MTCRNPLASLSPEQTNLKLTSRVQAPGICLETDHNAENKTNQTRTLKPNQNIQSNITNIPELLDLGEAVSSRIYDVEQCLKEITPQIEFMYMKRTSRGYKN